MRHSRLLPPEGRSPRRGHLTSLGEGSPSPLLGAQPARGTPRTTRWSQPRRDGREVLAGQTGAWGPRSRAAGCPGAKADGVASRGRAGLPAAASKKTQSSGSTEQTFIESTQVQGTVLGAAENTKNEQVRSLPARSSQSRMGGKTWYTIDCCDTSPSGRCPKRDTVLGVTGQHGAASGRKHWVQRARGWPVRGKPLGRRAVLAERRHTRGQEPTRDQESACGCSRRAGGLYKWTVKCSQEVAAKDTQLRVAGT